MKGKDVWVVYGDDHDYDYMSQWLVGVFENKADADKAVVTDRKRYVRQGGKRTDANYSVDCVAIGEVQS